MNAAAPSASTAKSDSLPGRGDARSAEFGIALTTISTAKAAIAASSQGEGTLRRSQSSTDGEHRGQEQRRVGRADRDRRAADADVEAGEVGCPKQAEAEGDEEDVEREFRHRQPSRAWLRAGHRESL